MLQSSLESCVATIISGRAGAGKTTVATEFAHVCQRQTAWYKVDATDFEAAVFFEYLVTSIQQQRPQFNEGAVLSLARDSNQDDIPLLAETLVYELIEADGGPLLIVIEDIHLICDTDWLVPFLRRFLPLLPGNIHVLITSRTLPPAPLWRMRSKQTLRVIEESVLAFTWEEAARLFGSYGLSESSARQAFNSTHGRAATLTLQVLEAHKIAMEILSSDSAPAAVNEPGNTGLTFRTGYFD